MFHSCNDKEKKKKIQIRIGYAFSNCLNEIVQTHSHNIQFYNVCTPCFQFLWMNQQYGVFIYTVTSSIAHDLFIRINCLDFEILFKLGIINGPQNYFPYYG